MYLICISERMLKIIDALCMVFLIFSVHYVLCILILLITIN